MRARLLLLSVIAWTPAWAQDDPWTSGPGGGGAASEAPREPADASAGPDQAAPPTAVPQRPTDADYPFTGKLALRLPRTRNGLRTMRYHAFIEPRGFDSAFVTTSLGIGVGVAIAQARQYTDANGETYDLQLIGLRQHLGFSVQFLKLLMLYAKGEGTLLVGSNQDSALNQGASAYGGWDAGLAFKVFRAPRAGTQLGVRLRFTGDRGIQVRPQSLVDIAEVRVAQTNTAAISSEELKTLLLRGGRTEGGLSLSLAQALGGRVASLQLGAGASAGTGYVEVSQDGARVRVDGTTIDVFGGAALTLDGWPVFPLAVQAEYAFAWSRFQTGGSRSDVLDHLVYGGIFYSGHPDFQVGLRAGGTVATSDPTAPQTVAVGAAFKAFL